MKNQARSHPLKWSTLRDAVERSGMDDPDVWIEDLRRYGACIGAEPELVCEEEDTDAVQASFSVITDVSNNRVVVRHHF